MRSCSVVAHARLERYPHAVLAPRAGAGLRRGACRLGAGKRAGYIVNVAFLLGVLLAGLVAAQLLRPGGLKLEEVKRWLPWVLAVPAFLLVLRSGMHWSVLVVALLAAALRGGLPYLRQSSAGAPGGASAGAYEANAAPRSRRMTRKEALEVLGLEEGASKSDVLREYRRLMKRLHPDVGGSKYLAAKLNEAREVLS